MEHSTDKEKLLDYWGRIRGLIEAVPEVKWELKMTNDVEFDGFADESTPEGTIAHARYRPSQMNYHVWVGIPVGQKREDAGK